MSAVVTLPVPRVEVAAVARRLPLAPQTFCRLERTLRDPHQGLDELLIVLNADTALATGVIKVANSASFARGQPVETVPAAINRIGFREVHKVAAMAVASQLFSRQFTFYHCAGALVCENAVAVATAAEMLSREAKQDSQACYAAGVLRPLGRIVVEMVCTQQPVGTVPFPDPQQALETWERRVVGMTAIEIATMLMLEWKFAPRTVMAVRHHQRPSEAGPHAAVAALVHLGAWVAQQLGKDLPGDAGQFDTSDAVLRAGGVSVRHVQAVIPAVRDELNRLRSTLAG